MFSSFGKKKNAAPTENKDMTSDIQEQLLKDPKVQAKAKHYAGKAMAFVGSAGDQMLKQIEQGPAGVRVLAFIGSAASATNAVMSLINILQVFGNTVLYMISCYQV